MYTKNMAYFELCLFYLVPVFIISLIIGLRYDVGVDYLAYKGLYETSFTGTIDESWGNLEFLYAIISYCCYKLGMPYYCCCS